MAHQPWHQEIRLPLTERRTVLQLAIPERTCWLEVRLELAEPALAFARLYNPEGLFVGEVSFWNETSPQIIYFGTQGCSLNALAHDLRAATYRLVCDLPIRTRGAADRQSQQNTLEGSLSGGSTESEPSTAALSEVVLQESAVVGPDGHVRRQERRLPGEHRYYRGDLHGHTDYSDGQLSNEEAWAVIDERGLDFMAITEHNALSFGQRQHRALHIPAFELTLPTGHLNVFGMEKVSEIPGIWDHIMENPQPDMAELLRHLRRDGSVVSLNHMFLAPWEFSAQGVGLDQIDTIEIICDPTYPDSPPANDKAVAFVDYLWNRGCRIYAVGGSDSHNRLDQWYDGADGPSVYGDPSTFVHAPELSLDTLLDGLRSGHAYVARHMTLDINIADGGVLPGACVDDYREVTTDFAYEVRVETFDQRYAASEYAAVFILNGHVVQRTSLDQKNPTAVLPSVREAVAKAMTANTTPYQGQDTGRPTEGPAGKAWWLRFGLVDPQTHVAAYVNPIFSGNFESCNKDIGQLIQEFDRSYDPRSTV